MADATRIFNGPAQITIYDSSNYNLALGYNENIEIKQKPIGWDLFNGKMRQYGMKTELEAVLLQTHPTGIKAIRDRRSTLQDVFVVGRRSIFKIHDAYTVINRLKDYDPGKAHQLIFSVFTEVEDDIEEIINILSSVKDSIDYGNMDTGSATISTGWNNSGCTCNRTTPSFLGAGYGYHQDLQITGASQSFYTTSIVCPLDTVPVKITASAYVKGSAVGAHQYKFGFKTLTSANAVLDDKTTNYSLADTDQERIERSVEFIPSSGVCNLRVYFESYGSNTADIDIDNVQLQIGALSAYTEND